MKLLFTLSGLVVVIIAGAVIVSNDDTSKQADTEVLNSEVSLDPGQISIKVANNEARLLDVRTTVEYDLEHAVSAENFNVEKLKAGELPDIQQDELVYVYCRSGNRSAQAKEILENAGYTNIVDLGGLNNWVERSGDTEQTQLESYLDILESIDREPIEALGDVDAIVTVVKYSDFSCPFCSRYSIETEPQILDTYIREGSGVRYEFKNYTVLGDESALAAVGGYCANEQQLFWEYHDTVNAGYSQLGPDYLTNDNFVDAITQLDGNGSDFTSCINSGLYEPVVSAEAIEAKNSGISSTPTIMINNQIIRGALPFSAYDTVIQSLL